MREFLGFIVKLVIFSMLVAVVLYFFIPAVPLKFRLNGWWKILCFFFITTSVFHLGLLASLRKRTISITIYYLAGTAIKFFMYLGIMIGYFLLFRQNAIPFVFTFFILYVFYTIFEVGMLYKKFSQPVKKVSAAE